MTPQAGDYFVVATTGWIARLIRSFTGSWANHAGIYDGQGNVIEATPSGWIAWLLSGGRGGAGGVRRSPLSKYDGCRIEWSSEDLTADQRARIVGAAEGMLGLPYSYVDILAMLVMWVPLIGVLARIRLDRGDRLICSQEVARVYRLAIGLVLVPGLADNFVRPKELADRIERGRR